MLEMIYLLIKFTVKSLNGVNASLICFLSLTDLHQPLITSITIMIVISTEWTAAIIISIFSKPNTNGSGMHCVCVCVCACPTPVTSLHVSSCSKGKFQLTNNLLSSGSERLRNSDKSTGTDQTGITIQVTDYRSYNIFL